MGGYIEERSKPVGDCWIWQKAISRDGYGKGKYGKERRAHRIAYLLHNGGIPDDMLVRHTCHNPLCVNPEHLVLGTQKQNVADAVEAGRNSRGQVSHLAKMSEGRAIDIIRQYYEGCSFQSLMEFHGMSHGAIYCLVTGRSWKHLNRASLCIGG